MKSALAYAVSLCLGVVTGTGVVIACGGSSSSTAQPTGGGSSTGGGSAITGGGCTSCTVTGQVTAVTAETDPHQLVTLTPAGNGIAVGFFPSCNVGGATCHEVIGGPFVVTGIYATTSPIRIASAASATGTPRWQQRLDPQTWTADGTAPIHRHQGWSIPGTRFFVPAGDSLYAQVPADHATLERGNLTITGFKPY